jgi:hypothetical protein
MKIGTLVLFAILAFMAYGLFKSLVIGNPDAANFEKACWDRESRGLSEAEFKAFETQIIIKCQRETRIHLGLKP